MKVLTDTQGRVLASNGKAYNAQGAAGAIFPQSYEWQQTPEAVQNFLDYVAANPYDPNNYDNSYIQNFAPATPVQANEQPIGQTVMTDAGILNVDGYEKTVSAGSNTIYNTVPNVSTPYALNDDGEIKQTGTLTPTATLRQIKASAKNVRDLGGWSCDGGTIKYGKIFRGGSVHIQRLFSGNGVTTRFSNNDSDANDVVVVLVDGAVTKDYSVEKSGTTITVVFNTAPPAPSSGYNIAITYSSISNREILVNQLGIRADLNLYASNGQQFWTESPLGKDVKFTVAETYNWYSLTNKNAWRTNIRAVFDAVAHDEPIYFHCEQGLDRTGTMAYIVAALLGISQSDCDTEYELSCFSTVIKDSTVFRRRNCDSSVSWSGGQTVWKTLVAELNTYTGNTLQDKAANFVATLGFTADEINAFRSGMIDGNPQPLSPVVNQIRNAINTDGTPYNDGLGYSALGLRIKSTGAEGTGTAFEWITGFIPLDGTTTIKLENINTHLNSGYSSYGIMVAFYDSTFTVIGSAYQNVNAVDPYGADYHTTYVKPTVPSNAEYIRICSYEYGGLTRDMATMIFE